MPDNIELILKEQVKKEISKQIDKEIQQKVENFAKELTDRKDDYIAQIMKGIRIYHERDVGSMGINYKILFENTYRIENKGVFNDERK